MFSGFEDIFGSSSTNSTQHVQPQQQPPSQSMIDIFGSGPTTSAPSMPIDIFGSTPQQQTTSTQELQQSFYEAYSDSNTRIELTFKRINHNEHQIKAHFSNLTSSVLSSIGL